MPLSMSTVIQDVPPLARFEAHCREVLICRIQVLEEHMQKQNKRGIKKGTEHLLGVGRKEKTKHACATYWQ